MRSTFKKGLSVLLALVLVFGSVAIGGDGIGEMLASFSIRAEALESTGNATFDAFINDSRFTHGISWGTIRPKLSSYDCWECCAYTADFVKYCFGYNTPKAGEYFTGATNIRAGDVIVVGGENGNGHWFVCLKRSGNSLYVAEGNYASKVRIGWNYTIVNDSTISGTGFSFSHGWHYLSADTIKPVIDLSTICVSSINSTGFTISCKITDNVGVARVTFPTWTAENGQDDLTWPNVTASGNVYSYTVKYSEHKNETIGNYFTDIYAYDAAGNEAKYASVHVRPSPTAITEGKYVLESKLAANKVLDVKDSSSANGANIQLNTYNGGNGQIFTISKVNAGYMIKPLCSGLAIDADGATANNGVNIMQCNINKNVNQMWYFVKSGSYYYIESQMGYYSITVQGAKTADGTNVILYQNQVSNDQLFTLLPVYTVSYNANGGSGAPSSQYKVNSKTLTLSSTKPTRSGYTFLGWSTSSSATSATYSAGGSFTANSNTTLYAVWSPTTYTVSFNANGGSVSPTSKTVSKGSTYGTLPTPTRTGYTFTGWYTAASGGTQITASSTVSITANQTLYAHWSLTNYTATLDHWCYGFNGKGTNGRKDMLKLATTSKNFTYSSGVSVEASDRITPDALPNGVRYCTWFGSSSFSDSWVNYGYPQTFNNVAKNVGIQINYELIDYNITYDLDGGTLAEPNPDTYNVVYGASFANEPTKEGCYFRGWTIDGTTTVTGVNKAALPDSAFVNDAGLEGGAFYNAVKNRTTGDITVKAKWADYKIAYNGNGGKIRTWGGLFSIEKMTSYEPTSITTNKVERSGFTFVGWALTRDAGADEVVYQPGDPYTAGEDLTLYAVWTPEGADYAIEYRANGGKFGSNSSTRLDYEPTAITTATPALDDSEDNKFLGWALTSDAAANDVIYLPGDPYTAAKTLTLYAVWGPNDLYRVTLDANGGTCELSRLWCTYNQSYGSLPTPTREGYYFTGWYTDDDVKVTGSSTFSVEDNQTLTAKWASYKIDYDGNGGGYFLGISKTLTEYDPTTITTANFTRNNYTFVGWALTPDATADDVVYQPGDPYESDEDLTLYAVWEPDGFWVTFSAGGGYFYQQPDYRDNLPPEYIKEECFPNELSQMKMTDQPLTLGSMIPKRLGYRFVKWENEDYSQQRSAFFFKPSIRDKLQEYYCPGDVYDVDYRMHLYPVWEEVGVCSYRVEICQRNAAGEYYAMRSATFQASIGDPVSFFDTPLAETIPYSLDLEQSTLTGSAADGLVLRAVFDNSVPLNNGAQLLPTQGGRLLAGVTGGLTYRSFASTLLDLSKNSAALWGRGTSTAGSARVRNLSCIRWQPTPRWMSPTPSSSSATSTATGGTTARTLTM